MSHIIMCQEISKLRLFSEKKFTLLTVTKTRTKKNAKIQQREKEDIVR